MTFDEYWRGVWAMGRGPAAFDLAMREIAEKAWNAAIEEEREACAMVCEFEGEGNGELSSDLGMAAALLCANAIRERNKC